MNRNISVTAYTRQLSDYYHELAESKKSDWNNSPMSFYLESVLDKVQQLPSPEREERFVEEILGNELLRLKRAA